MCDTVVLVESDRVLFAKNSDRDPNEAQILEWHPSENHEPGARLQATWIEIPQVPHTHAVLLSRPFWMWGAEMGTNQWGVTIGNEAVFTRQPLAQRGLTGMDLLRLALERADSAERAVRVIVDLIEAFGQGGGCGLENRRFSYHNSFLVADPRQAFVLETAGRHWAVEPVAGRRSISNGLSIGPFAAQHSEPLKTRVAAAAIRRARTECLAQAVRHPGDLMALLRDHGGDRVPPRYRLLGGGIHAPCMHAGGLVAASQTTASWVAELSPRGVRHWATATAAPCTGLFKPISLDEPLALPGMPREQADAESLWWRHERLHRRVMADPQELGKLYFAERDAVEREWLARPPDSATAFAKADRLLARWTDSVAQYVRQDHRPWWVRRYWARRNRWAGLDARIGAASAAMQAKPAAAR